MYVVKNTTEDEQVLYLLDYSRTWNGRMITPIKSGKSIVIRDDQLSSEIQTLEKKGILKIVELEEDVVEESTVKVIIPIKEKIKEKIKDKEPKDKGE